MTFDPVAEPAPSAIEASDIVWFDAWTSNVDRTARNPNLLSWHGRLWLIDHGASLYFHHAWDAEEARSRSPFTPVKEHVLLPWASDVAGAYARLVPRFGTEGIARVLALVPDDWLADEARFATPAEHRAAYVGHLLRRLESSAVFVEEAERARASLV